MLQEERARLMTCVALRGKGQGCAFEKQKVENVLSLKCSFFLWQDKLRRAVLTIVCSEMLCCNLLTSGVSENICLGNHPPITDTG